MAVSGECGSVPTRPKGAAGSSLDHLKEPDHVAEMYEVEPDEP